MKDLFFIFFIFNFIFNNYKLDLSYLSKNYEECLELCQEIDSGYPDFMIFFFLNFNLFNFFKKEYIH